MMFKPGDRVFFLETHGLAIVLEVEGARVQVYHQGMVIPCMAHELVPEHQTSPSEIESNAPIPPTLPTVAPIQKSDPQGVKDDFFWENKRRIPKVSGKDSVPIKDKDRVKPKGFPVHKGKKEPDYMEIDLHLEALIEDVRDISPGEALQIQLHQLFLFMEEVKRKKIRRAFVIHGVGKGKLKEEVLDFLHRYAEAESFAAPYRLYGQGATEIRMHYGENRTQLEDWMR
jgi:hypothetical protein